MRDIDLGILCQKYLSFFLLVALCFGMGWTSLNDLHSLLTNKEYISSDKLALIDTLYMRGHPWEVGKRRNNLNFHSQDNYYFGIDNSLIKKVSYNI